MTNCGARRDLGQCRVPPSLASGKTKAQRQPHSPQARTACSPGLRVPGPCSLSRRGQKEQRSPKVTPPLMQAQQMPGPRWHLEMPSKSGQATSPRNSAPSLRTN